MEQVIRLPLWPPAHAAHRLLFGVGACTGSALALWWAIVLCLPWTGRSVAWAAPPVTAHGLVMTFGFFPWFIAGFAHTAGPRWLRVPPPPARRPVAVALTYLGGLSLTVTGLHLNLRWSAVGLLLCLLAWIHLTLRFAALRGRSDASDRLHATGLIGTMGVIGLALGVASLACGTGRLQWLHAALHLALWGGGATTYTFAAHRMTPFFHSPLRKMPETTLLMLLLAAFGLQALRVGCEDLGRPWPPAGLIGVALLQGLTGLLLMAVTFDREICRASRPALMRHLRRGVRWLSVALCGLALSNAPSVHACWPGIEAVAQHILILGFMGTTLLAMATRITATQSGRAVVIDAHGERLHRLLQGVVLARAVGAFWPEVSPFALTTAALGWSVLWGAWASRWVPIVLRRRRIRPQGDMALSQPNASTGTGSEPARSV